MGIAWASNNMRGYFLIALRCGPAEVSQPGQRYLPLLQPEMYNASHLQALEKARCIQKWGYFSNNNNDGANYANEACILLSGRHIFY